MTEDHVCTLPARMDCLGQALVFVEELCREEQVASNDALRLSLVVEELFTNTVMHGHGGDSDAPVRVGISVGSSTLDLTYEDTAPPFDPVDHVARSTNDLEEDPISELPVGHVGIALVVNMAVRVSYLREGGWNRLHVALQRHR